MKFDTVVEIWKLEIESKSNLMMKLKCGEKQV